MSQEDHVNMSERLDRLEAQQSNLMLIYMNLAATTEAVLETILEEMSPEEQEAFRQTLNKHSQRAAQFLKDVNSAAKSAVEESEAESGADTED